MKFEYDKMPGHSHPSTIRQEIVLYYACVCVCVCAYVYLCVCVQMVLCELQWPKEVRGLSLHVASIHCMWPGTMTR